MLGYLLKISCLTSCMIIIFLATGVPNLESASAELVSHFGSADSPYQVALAKRADKKYPVPGPWINGGVIQFLKNKVYC